MNLPIGLHKDIPNAEYHALPYVSNSQLSRLARSPAHYKCPVELADTPAIRFGSLFHSMIEGKFNDAAVVAPDMDKRTKEWKAFVVANPGKECVSQDEFATLKGMIDSIAVHKTAKILLEMDGISEASIIFDVNGRRCRARPDKLIEATGIVVDWKTCADASPGAWCKSIANFGYHRQQAFYLDAVASIGMADASFCFVAVEKVAPFAVGVYVLDSDSVAKGREEITALLAKLDECEKSGNWPAYSDEIQTIALPKWYGRNQQEIRND